MKKIRINKHLKLFFAMIGLYIILVVILPLINSLPYMSDLQACIKKWDINTAAFFYTDDISSEEEITRYTDL